MMTSLVYILLPVETVSLVKYAFTPLSALLLLQDTRMDGCGDGSWNGEQYFSCRDGHGMFIVLSKLKLDSRFIQQPQGPNRKFQCLHQLGFYLSMCNVRSIRRVSEMSWSILCLNFDSSV